MKKLSIVIDTNILISALRSNLGASYKLVSLIPSDSFSINVSVPLVVEYEDVLKRPELLPHLTSEDIDAFIDYIVSVSLHREIHYLWRPFLKDPNDDMLVELAVASEADAIVTYNKKDFKGVEEAFGIKILDAREFLVMTGVLK